MISLQGFYEIIYVFGFALNHINHITLILQQLIQSIYFPDISTIVRRLKSHLLPFRHGTHLCFLTHHRLLCEPSLLFLLFYYLQFLFSLIFCRSFAFLPASSSICFRRLSAIASFRLLPVDSIKSSLAFMFPASLLL